MKRQFFWLAPVLLTGLLGCGQTTSTTDASSDGDSLPPARNTGGSFSGTVNFAPGTLSLPFETPSAPQGDIIPGQLIVKFKSGLSVQSVSTLSVNGAPVQRLRALALDGAGVYRIAGADARRTEAVARQLTARPDVEYAEPDRRLYAAAPLVPNDNLYLANQWNLQAGTGGIRMPDAWGQTTGTGSTVVAVVDTGILFRAGDTPASHPDLPAAQMLQGYDFISNANCSTGAACSGDGDGRDNDPYDTGDHPTSPSYHGTFVAGIVGAATNNGVGLAGVNWKTRILPVRVLGPGGGTASDIIDALLYSAGVADSPVPNPHPADVINLSLGGEGQCGTAFQAAINKALNGPRNPLIVVAAGNGGRDGVGDDAKGTFPANCQGVMAVGATTRSGVRAGYSNYGSVLSVVAPGGGGTDGVWSLTRRSGQFSYGAGAGTSYAAPHVAGLAALLRAVKPGLSALQLQRLMEDTARPVNCNNLSSENCGKGLIDAAAALKAAGDPAAMPTFALSPVSNVRADPGSSVSVTVNIQRSAGFTGEVDLSVTNLPTGVTASFSEDPTAGATSTLTLKVASGTRLDTYALTIVGVSGSQRHSTALNLKVGSALSVRGTVVAADYYERDWTRVAAKSRSIVIENTGSSSSFVIAERSAGWYFVYAVQDTNGDKKLSAGDYLGYSEFMLNPPHTGIVLEMEQVTDVAELRLPSWRLQRIQQLLAEQPD